MSQENVALARKAYKRLGDGSVALFAEHADSDVEWIPDRRVGEGPIQGRDKVIEFFADRASMFAEMESDGQGFGDREEALEAAGLAE